MSYRQPINSLVQRPLRVCAFSKNFNSSFYFLAAKYTQQVRLSSTSQQTGSSERRKWLTRWRKWLVAGTTGMTGYLLGSWNFQHFPPQRDALDIDIELNTVPEYKYIHSHPLAKKLRDDPEVEETRYYDKIPVLHRENMLTTGLLAGKGALTVEPLVFRNKRTGEAHIFYHLGNRMDGHDGIVHGGLLATLMDEGLTRTGFPFLPSKYGVTASLNLNYRAPVRSDSYIVLVTGVDEVKGRKVVVKGRLESLPESGSPITLVEAEIILVEPKWAKYVTWLFH